MKLSARSYPHPVLGNGDDVPSAAFQGTIEMSSDRQYVHLTVGVACSSSDLNALKETGYASFVLHVECSNTLFRKIYSFPETEKRISVSADHLNETVEVNLIMCAAQPIEGYRNSDAHADYGDASFDIRRGDILAIAEGQVFYIESDFDSLRHIGSIMQISESQKAGDSAFQADFEGDKIVIYLSKPDFSEYKLLKQNEAVPGPLTSLTVLPVLVEAIDILKKDSHGLDDGRRWVRALSSRIEHAGLDQQTDSLSLAQQLLELPLKRALASSRLLAEAS